MSADTTLMPIPGRQNPVPVPRAVKPRGYSGWGLPYWLGSE